MINLHIKTIPYKKQEYDTCGNYGMNKNGSIWVTINDMSDERAEWLVALHEAIELTLTRFRAIDWELIDEFDKKFSKKNKEDEPGDNKKAPYHKEHVLATKIEKVLCRELGLSWKKYNKIVYDSCK